MTETNKDQIRAKHHLGKVYIISFFVFWLIALLIKVIAGNHFMFRDSRGNIYSPIAETGTAEVNSETVIEAVFSAKIHKIDNISIQLGTYHRPCAGILHIEIVRNDNNSVIRSTDINATDFTDGEWVVFENIDEDLYDIPLRLKMYSDSPVGMALTPLVSKSFTEGINFTVNGEEVNESLCISITGRDVIWLGKNYWKIVGIVGGAVAVIFLISWLIYYKIERGILAGIILSINKYGFLIRQLVARDFKTKYKRSVLGVLWSFINPLLTMIVQYVVFSTIFKSDIEFYLAYLLIGIVSFNFFSEACGMALGSVVGNAHLVNKVYVPKYVYPMSRIISSIVNLAISLIPMLAICLFTGVRLGFSAFLMIYFLACLIIFSFGLGMLLSALMVFFRDMQFLWGVISMIWMYCTPIFYPESILIDECAWILDVNPVYYFIKGSRICMLDGSSPEPIFYAQCLLMAIGMLIVGSIIFKISEDKFILYL